MDKTYSWLHLSFPIIIASPYGPIIIICFSKFSTLQIWRISRLEYVYILLLSLDYLSSGNNCFWWQRTWLYQEAVFVLSITFLSWSDYIRDYYGEIYIDSIISKQVLNTAHKIMLCCCDAYNYWHLLTLKLVQYLNVVFKCARLTSARICLRSRNL